MAFILNMSVVFESVISSRTDSAPELGLWRNDTAGGHEDTGSGADLHVAFTTSGQFLAVFTVGRKAVGDKRSLPDCGQIDGWMAVSNMQHFSKQLALSFAFGP